MQVIVLAIQNDAPPGDLGAATSATNFLRQLGGSFGTAAFGAVFAGRLADQLAARLPADAGARLPAGGVNAITPALVHTLPPPVRAGFVGAYVDAWRPSSATWCPWRWWRSRWRGCCPSCHCAATSQAPDLPARPCRLDARAQTG
jgi:hypothetical protein